MSQEYDQVLIGEPADYPQAFIDEIKSLLKTIPEAKKAWLLMVVHMSGKQNFLLVVDYKGDYQKIFDVIGQIVSVHLKQDQFIDMIPFSDGFGRDAVKSYRPFYKKGIF